MTNNNNWKINRNVGKTSILQTLRRETKGTLIPTLGTEDFYVTKSVKTFNFSEAGIFFYFNSFYFKKIIEKWIFNLAPSEETVVRGDIFLVCYSIGDLQSLNNVFEKVVFLFITIFYFLLSDLICFSVLLYF